MAASQPDRLFCPSDKTIAFAISIVQSKPPELTMTKYISLLRNHIAKGRRENALSNVHHHLDRSSYWRAEYERINDSLKAAEDETADLRQQIETLKSKVDSARNSSTTKKRKKPDIDTIPVPRSPKKAKRDVSPARTLPITTDSSTDMEFSQAGEIGDALLRCLFYVHSHLKRGHKTDPNDLAYYIVRAASVIAQLVQQEVEKIILDRAASNDKLQTTLTVTARAVALIFAGCNRLSHVQDGAALRGKIIYATVHMFKDLLDNFETIYAEEIDESLRSGAAEVATASPVKTKSKPKTKVSKAPNIKENPTLGLYTSFLTSIVDKLDAKVEANKEIFEGFAYCIIQKLGSRLYATVFGHSRGADLEAEIQQSTEADGIEEGHHTPLPQSEHREQKQIRLEAPYLVHLLNRIMAAAPPYLGAIPRRTSKAKQASKASLAITAKERLQQTLINCTFGMEGNDEEDLFKDCLKMPAVSEGVVPIPKVKEEDVQIWFKEELWRVLGWDILAKEDDC